MKNTTGLLLFFAFLICFFSPRSFAQDLTNEGTDFWVAFPEVFDNTNAIFEINVSSRFATTGLVEIPGTAFSQAITLIPGFVTTVTLPSIDADIIEDEVILDVGIHITSVDPVTVYASTFHLYRSEASVVLPVPSLGSNYMVTTYKNFSLNKSEFIVVAGSAPCEFVITPACDTEGAGIAGTPMAPVTLNPGEVYMVQAADGTTNDLTGTTVVATNGTDKFAVFNGHVFAQVGVCLGSTKDPIFDQAFPINTWGFEYIVVKTEGQNINTYRATASVNATEVFEDGVSLGIIDAGEYIDVDFSDEILFISANNPFCVTQSLQNASCSGNNAADPAMVVLNSNEQMFLDTATFFAVDYNGLDTNYLNVVTRTIDIGLVQLNGVVVGGWLPVPADAAYSYTITGIDIGSHTLTTTGCGFLAYTYGHQWAESYFYSAGVGVNNINDSLAMSQYLGTNPNFCDIDTVLFEAFTSGGTVLSYQWDFGDGATSTLQNPLHVYLVDGTFEVTLVVEYLCKMDTLTDSITIFSTPTVTNAPIDITCFGFADGTADLTLTGGTAGFTYLWSDGSTTEDLTGMAAGNYTVEIIDAMGCLAWDTLDILEPPEMIVNLLFNDPTCFGYTDGDADVISVIGGTAPIDYSWSTGGTTSTELGLGAGSYSVTVTDDNGCVYIESFDLISASAVVIPDFIDTTICLDGDIFLSAVASGGIGAPYTYNWTESGITVPAGITIPLNDACYIVVATDGNGCVSAPIDYCVEVLDSLSLNLLTSDICPGALAQVDAFVGGGFGSGYSYSWTSSAGVVGSSEDLSIDQNIPTENYCLTLNDGCETPAVTKCVIVDVYAVPTVALLFQDGCEPLDANFNVLSDASLVSTSNWDFGDGNFSTATSPSHQYEWPGVFDVEVTYTTIDGCIVNETFNNIVEVYETPYASFTHNRQGQVITVEDTEISFLNTSGSGDSYYWDFGDGKSSNQENPHHVYPQTGGIGYDISLTVTSQFGCEAIAEGYIYIDELLIYYIPNAFTPDGDQYNDNFKPIFTEGYDPYDYHMTVFNKWGEVLFESFNAEYGWDGTYKGNGLVKDGVYIWQIEFGETYTDKRNIIRGHVTILK
ncbi:PKD domain-containing protein [Crocinitomix catalasitica]|nr:PKD domain-containing protein [Crocinitomix catalasitica]